MWVTICLNMNALGIFQLSEKRTHARAKIHIEVHQAQKIELREKREEKGNRPHNTLNIKT